MVLGPIHLVTQYWDVQLPLWVHYVQLPLWVHYCIYFETRYSHICAEKGR